MVITCYLSETDITELVRINAKQWDTNKDKKEEETYFLPYSSIQVCFKKICFRKVLQEQEGLWSLNVHLWYYKQIEWKGDPESVNQSSDLLKKYHTALIAAKPTKTTDA